MSRLLHAAAQARQPTYGWLIACDDARVTAHLGVAELSHSYEYARKALNELIDWHKARELADHFAAQRPWIGLTDDDRFEIAAEQHGWEDLLIAAEARLKEKNT